MLKMPSSTLRRYANQYQAHLSEHATKQRNRRYTEQDITILARARELLREGKSPKQVNKLLSVVSDGEQPSPDQTLALILSISQPSYARQKKPLWDIAGWQLLVAIVVEILREVGWIK
jgi:DNA-binding transcriptional MerR regulator